MKILKKNQLALLVISLMLITAGYLNYNATILGNTGETSANSLDVASIGDATLVNANVVTEGELVANEDLNEELVDNLENNTEETTANIKTDTNSYEDYFKSSKLERNIMYSQMIERYQGIMNNSNSEPEQKMIAEQEIDLLNNLQNAIMISENLLTTKGFNENVIFVNGESINVIIGKEELSQSEIAQIQNIIARELSADIENIHISTK